MTSGSTAAAELGALDQLSQALGQVTRGLTNVEASVRRDLSAVQKRVQDELMQRRAALVAARQALRACSSRKNADCSALVAAVEAAERRLQTAQQAQRIAQDAAARLTPAMQRIGRATDRLVGSGQQELRTNRAHLEAYLEAGMSSGSVSHAESGPTSAPSGSGASGSGGGTTRLAGMPDGFAMVSTDLIDTADSSVQGPGDFTKGYSPDDLAWSFRALDEVVMPALGKGLGRDYFQERDAAEGRMGVRSYSDCYSGFFGADAPQLSARSSGYGIENGYHRVWVAQRYGFPAIPARISGKAS